MSDPALQTSNTHHMMICHKCKVKMPVANMTTIDEIKEFITKHLHCQYLQGIVLEPLEGYGSPHRSRHYKAV